MSKNRGRPQTEWLVIVSRRHESYSAVGVILLSRCLEGSFPLSIFLILPLIGVETYGAVFRNGS